MKKISKIIHQEMELETLSLQYRTRWKIWEVYIKWTNKKTEQELTISKEFPSQKAAAELIFNETGIKMYAE